jgi:DNA sulfur modification protein DndE
MPGRCVTAAAVVLGLTVIAPAPATAAGARGTASAAQERRSARALGVQAYIYGVPLVDWAQRRRSETSVTVPNGETAAPINQLAKAGYYDPSNQIIPAPSTDTLYTSIQLDLSRQPQVLRIPPATDGRFWNMEMIDPYTNVFAYVGTRCNGAAPPPFAGALEACAATTGQAGGDFAIMGPRWRGRLPAGVIPIRAPYDRIWIGGRTLVMGTFSQADIDAARAVQASYTLQPLSTYPAGYTPRPPRVVKTTPTPFRTLRGLRWYDFLGRQLAANPPPPRDRPLLRRLRRVGIGPGLLPSRENLPRAVERGLREAIPIARRKIQAQVARATRQALQTTNGWSVPPADTGDFGTNYLTRAVIDVYGIGANRPIEGMYPTAFVDSSGRPLNGDDRYVLTFPAASGTPPFQTFAPPGGSGFWSVTVYDEQLFLGDPPYAVGNRSALVPESDGSIEILLQQAQPADATANWLRVPDEGFRLTMRIYIPQQQVVAGDWEYPTITRVSSGR